MLMKSKFAMKTLLVGVSLFFVIGCTSISAQETTDVKGFSIQSGKLIDANGNEFIMKGVNHAHNWYNGQDETALKAIAKTGANTVRLVLSNGVQWNYDDVVTVKRLIELCKENKLIAILEVHDATGKDSVDDLQKAIDYWIDIKEALIGNEDTVILNIANEWHGSWASDAWAQGYIKMIPQLRAAGIKNTIMVDCAGWGQYPTSIKDKGKAAFAADPDANTMFSMHLYEYAGGNAAQIKSNIDGVTSQGLAVCVGEFAYKHTDGDVDEEYILNYTEEQGIGWLGWSWYGNSDYCKYLDMATDMAGTNYTEWGKILMEHEYGLPTAKTCSVFDIIDPVEPEQPDVPEPVEPVEPEIPVDPDTPVVLDKLAFEYDTHGWGAAYQMNLRILNNSDSEVDGWKLKLKKSDFTVSSSWNVTITEEGEYLVLEPVGWNNKIAAHNKVEFGVIFTGDPLESFDYVLE